MFSKPIFSSKGIPGTPQHTDSHPCTRLAMCNLAENCSNCLNALTLPRSPDGRQFTRYCVFLEIDFVRAYQGCDTFVHMFASLLALAFYVFLLYFGVRGVYLHVPTYRFSKLGNQQKQQMILPSFSFLMCNRQYINTGENKIAKYVRHKSDGFYSQAIKIFQKT